MLRAHIVEILTPYLGGDFDVSSVYISPWSFGIRDARIKLSDVPLKIIAKRIRIEFNIFTVLKNRLRFESGTEGIYFEEPRLFWSFDTNNVIPDTFPVLGKSEISLSDLPFMRINIVRGSVIFTRGDSTLVFANNINGWMDGFQSPRVMLNMEGEVLSEEINTTCKGSFDRINKRVSLDIASAQCDISRKGINIISGDIYPESGSLDVTVHIEKSYKSFTLDGTYSIQKGSFLLKDSHIIVNDVSTKGRIKGDELVFESLTGKVWGVSPEMSGQIKLRPSLTFNLVLNAENIDLPTVLSELKPEIKEYPNGHVNLTSTAQGSLHDLSVNTTLSSDSLWYHNNKIYDTVVKLEVADGNMTLKHFGALYRGFRFEGHGETKKLSPPLNLAAMGENINLIVNAYNLRDPEKIYNINVKGNARPDKKEYYAHFDLTVNRIYTSKIRNTENSVLDTLSGSFSLINEKLKYNLGNSFLSFSGTADNIFNEAAFSSKLTLTQFPVLKIFGVHDIDFFADGSGNIDGNLEKMSLAGGFRIQSGKNLNSQLSGEATIQDIFSDSRTISVNANILNHNIYYSQPTSWKLSTHSDSLSTTAVLIDPDGAEMKINALHTTGGLSGYLILDKFPLERFIDIFKQEEFSYKGKLTGKIVLGGIFKEPYFISPDRILIDDLNVGGLNFLSGTGYVSGNFDELAFTDVNMSRKNSPIMHADGRWRKGQPFVLDAYGNNVSVAAISDIISQSRTCDGISNYSFQMVFTRKDGTIDGNFTFRDGHFLDVPFDMASGVFGGGSEGFHVTKFTINKEGVYTGKGSASSGYIWKDNIAPGLRMNLFFQGNLLSALPHLTGAVKKASGESQLDLIFGGSWQDPIILDGELYVTRGMVEPAYIIDTIEDINAILVIDPDFDTVSGMKAVRLRAGSGLIDDRKLIVRNIQIGDEEWEKIQKPELLSIVDDEINLDFGILTVRIDKGKHRDASLEFNIPGFMKPKNKGVFLFPENDGRPFFIGASDNEDRLTPYIAGNIVVLSGDVTYPLLVSDTSGESADFLGDIFWNLNFRAGSNVNYVHEDNITLGSLYGTTVSRTLAKLDENSVFTVTGRLSDGNLRVTGNAHSSSGTISYYGAEFDIERAELELDTSNSAKPATLTARARTVVYDESTGIDTEIFLNVYSIDRESGRRSEAPGRVEIRKSDDIYTHRAVDAGGLEMIQIEFISNNPFDDTQEKILARLGISPENIGVAATRAFAAGVDNYYVNPFMRTFEDVVRKYTRLDVVRITSTFLGNIVQSKLGNIDKFGPDSDYMLFDRTRVMFGEYLLDDWFFSYRGQYGIGRDFLQRKERGFYHELGLQYLLKANTRLQFNYNYDEIINKGEKRIEIRHNFEF